MTATAREVAQWMLEELRRKKCLYQNSVVYDIEVRFGKKFVYINDSGNQAIGRDVLKEFREVTKGAVIWERGERMWRFREEYDEPGRAQY